MNSNQTNAELLKSLNENNAFIQQRETSIPANEKTLNALYEEWNTASKSLQSLQKRNTAQQIVNRGLTWRPHYYDPPIPKNKKDQLAFLQSLEQQYGAKYVPNSRWFSRKKTRIQEARNLAINNIQKRLNKKWQNEAPKRNQLNATIQNRADKWRKLKTKVNTNATALQTRKSTRNAKIKQKLLDLGFTYVPLQTHVPNPDYIDFQQSQTSNGRVYGKGGAYTYSIFNPPPPYIDIPEHFIYETSKLIQEATPQTQIPPGWTLDRKEKRKKTRYTPGQGYQGQYGSEPYNVILEDWYLQRPLPPGYPEGQILKENWAKVVKQILSSAPA